MVESVTSKVCGKCQQNLPIDNFWIDNSARTGFSSYCKKCSKERRKKYAPRRKQLDLIYMNKEENFIRGCINRIFKPSQINPKKFRGYQRRGWKPEITKAELYGEWIFHMQLMQDKYPGTNGKLCRICETHLTFKRLGDKQKIPTNFSIDRFNAMQTYKKGNIIFCCQRCNTLKNGSTKAMWLKLLEIDGELNQQQKENYA